LLAVLALQGDAHRAPPPGVCNSVSRMVVQWLDLDAVEMRISRRPGRDFERTCEAFGRGVTDEGRVDAVGSGDGSRALRVPRPDRPERGGRRAASAERSRAHRPSGLRPRPRQVRRHTGAPPPAGDMDPRSRGAMDGGGLPLPGQASCDLASVEGYCRSRPALPGVLGDPGRGGRRGGHPGPTAERDRGPDRDRGGRAPRPGHLSLHVGDDEAEPGMDRASVLRGEARGVVQRRPARAHTGAGGARLRCGDRLERGMSVEHENPFRLRPAAPGDADGCARVHHTSWVETYSGLLPAAHWETDTLARRKQRWRRSLAGGADVTVAEAGGEIIGFAM